MKAIVATEAQSVKYYYRKCIVEEGVYPYSVNSLSELEDKVEKRGADCLIIDIDLEVYDGLVTLKRIRELFSFLYIIVITAHNDFEFVQRINDYKVFGIVSKLDDLDGQIRSIKYLMGLIKGLKGECRYSIRVKPYHEEHNICVLMVWGLETVYYAKVKDISRSGVSLEFLQDTPSESIIYKDKSLNIRIELGIYAFDIEAVVFLRTLEKVILVFRQFSEVDNKKLYEYILSRID